MLTINSNCIADIICIIYINIFQVINILKSFFYPFTNSNLYFNMINQNFISFKNSVNL